MNVYITRINGLPLEEQTQYMQNMTTEIAQKLGMKEMGIYRYNGEAENVESLNARMDGIIAGINRGDLIICQFPTGNGLRFEWSLINHLKAYGGRAAIFLHDFEPLLFENKRSTLQETVNLYNQAEVLIVPSLAMRQFLLEKRIRRDMKFVIQEMWDYTVETNIIDLSAYKEKMVFADNRKFGMFWYKDANEHQYMEYGSSFLLSKFLAAGIPVIVPYGISNQRVIKENNLGLIVNSPDEATNRIEAMSEAEYQDYVQSVRQFAPALRKGYYTEKSLMKAVHAFYRKDTGWLAVPVTTFKLEESCFSSVNLKESYGENLVLSWSYKGNRDGFVVYDAEGKLIYETENIHQHYCLIKGYERNAGFTVCAYVETLKGKLIITGSELTYLNTEFSDRVLVSIIIPAYNAQDYIVRSIDSVLAQSFPDLEIIIVDDGSTDRTPDIVDWYARKYSNVKAIHQKNSGVAAARNAGIMQANGEYIGFMDNDDMFYPNMVARLYRSAKKNDCDIAVTSVYQIKNSGYEAFIQYPMEEDTAITIEDFFQMHFNKGCMFAVVIWNKLYRAELVKSHLIPVMIADDNAWTPYILSYAESLCYLDDCSYEWDRKIRSSTQVDQWQRRGAEELFQSHKETIMFYLKNGNPERIELLKQLAGRQLSEMGRAYSYEEYEKLWQWIQETF